MTNPKGLWICPSDKPAKEYPNTYPPSGWGHTYWHVGRYRYEYLSYAFHLGNTENAYYNHYGLHNWQGPEVRRITEIGRTGRTLMFVEGSMSRSHVGWNIEVGLTGPLDPFHYKGKRINLLACDGHAVTLGPSDFADYSGEEVYTDEGKLAVYALPEFWFHIDK